MAFFCGNLQMIEEKPQIEICSYFKVSLAEINLISWQVSYTQIYYLIGHFLLEMTNSYSIKTAVYI